MRIHHATAAKAKKFGIVLTIEEGHVVASKNGATLASGLQGNKVLEDAITKATGKPTKGTPEAKAAAKAARQATKVEPVTDPFEVAAKAEGWKKTRWGFRNADDEDSKPEAETWEDLCEEVGIEVEGSDEEADAETETEDGDEDGDEKATASVVKDKYKLRYKAHKGTCGDDFALKFKDYLTVETEEGDRIDTELLKRFAEANDVWVHKYQGMLRHRSGPGLVRMNVSNRLRAKMRKDPKFKIVWPE